MAENNIVSFVAKVARRIRPRSNNLLLAPRFPQYEIGKGTYGDLQVIEFGEGAVLKIGAYSSLAKGVQIFLGGEHRPDWVTTYPFSAFDAKFAGILGHPQTRGDVVIGNDVWIGREAMIRSGVTIGDGAVIGARALVTNNVEPYTIVAGSPAKFIKSRFAPKTVERLLAVAWWKWPTERVESAVPLMLTTDIEAFLDAAERGAI